MESAQPRFLSAKECAAALGLEPDTFKAMVAKGDLPQPISITGKRLKMWPAEDVQGMAWLMKTRDRLRKSTADETEEMPDD